MFFALFLNILARRERTKEEQKYLGCCLEETDASGHQGKSIDPLLKGNSFKNVAF